MKNTLKVISLKTLVSLFRQEEEIKIKKKNTKQKLNFSNSVKKPKKRFGWIASGIAAGLALTLFSYNAFSPNLIKTDENHFVTFEKKNIENEKVTDPSITILESIKEEKIIIISNKEDNSKIYSKSKVSKAKMAIKNEPKQNILAFENKIKDIPSKSPIGKKPMFSNDYEIMKDENIVTKVSEKSDIMTNDLSHGNLANTQLHLEEKATSSKLKINAMALLKEAESASAQSFMSKVFKGIQGTSSTLLTSVSSRNQIKDQ